jgi:hypothetical protein
MSGLGGVLLISVVLSAQRQADAAGLRAALSHIDDGVVVRVRVAAGPVLSGRYAGIVGDTMVLGPSGAGTRLSTASLDSVWTRHRPVVSKGIQGVLLGALLGGVWELAATLNASCHSTSFSSSRFPYPACHFNAGNVGRIVARWAAVGGATGAGLGVAFPVWRLRFP